MKDHPISDDDLNYVRVQLSLDYYSDKRRFLKGASPENEDIVCSIIARLEAAEAIVAKLPKTADGVHLIPLVDVTLWTQNNLSEPEEGFIETTGCVRWYIDGSGDEPDGWHFSSHHKNQCWPPTACYSTCPAPAVEGK